MVRRVAWLEPVLCASEHEAAFLESDFLERHPTRYNRTLGMESCVWLRLDPDPRHPSMAVVHDPAPGDGADWYGPYLGWEPARQASAGLLRLYPIHYSGTALSRSDRELACSLGVSEADLALLARRIRRVLRRDAAAVGAAIRDLEQIRDRAADCLMFEHAALLQQQIRGLRWIAEPQKLSALECVDGDYGAVAAGHGVAVAVILSLRAGRLAQRHVQRLVAPDQFREGLRRRGRVAAEWIEMARQNAELMAKLAAAEAIGPLAWRT
jgi:excinuclease ABC subunit C